MEGFALIALLVLALAVMVLLGRDLWRGMRRPRISEMHQHIVDDAPSTEPTRWLALTYGEMVKLRDKELDYLLEVTRYPVQAMHVRDEINARSGRGAARLAIVLAMVALILSLAQAFDEQRDDEADKSKATATPTAAQTATATRSPTATATPRATATPTRTVKPKPRATATP